MITVENTDEFFNKCSNCGNDEDTKKVTIGTEERNESFVLCKECREKLYIKLKKSLDSHETVKNI